MAIGAVLGRVVILPLFCQIHDGLHGALQRLDRWCSTDELLDVDSFTRAFGDESFRPHSFLSDPRVPFSALQGGLDGQPRRACIRSRYVHCPNDESGGITNTYIPSQIEKGASEREIRGWFDTKEFKDVPMLTFSNLAGAFGSFENDLAQTEFEEKVSNGLQVRET